MPPLALISSRQISWPSNAGLPPPARPPVSVIDKPILIGGPSAPALPTNETPIPAIAAPRNVLRFIIPPVSGLFWPAPDRSPGRGRHEMSKISAARRHAATRL